MRTSDVAIRIALGAAHGRLIRQVLLESVALALPGGAIGFLAGISASGFLARKLLGTSGPLAPAFSPDARVILFAVGLSLATAVLFGVAPALRATRAGYAAYAASVTTSARRTIAHSSLKGMRPLVAAQLAMSFVAAVAAVLLGRTLINLTRLDPGFAIDHLVGVGFDAAGSGYYGRSHGGAARAPCRHGGGCSRCHVCITREVRSLLQLLPIARLSCRLVVRDALKVIVAGLLAGVLTAVTGGRMLETLLFDVSVSDPMTYVLVLSMLLAITLAAAYLPARRAAHVNPMHALRSE